jgi:hypothetical protein
MAKEYDRRPAFEKFLKGVSALLADGKFREVLLEIDAEDTEAVNLLATDPAAFLRYRGVRIPEDFRLSIEETSGESARGRRIVCYCLKICWWRWCIEICFCKIVTSSVVA